MLLIDIDSLCTTMLELYIKCKVSCLVYLSVNTCVETVLQFLHFAKNKARLTASYLALSDCIDNKTKVMVMDTFVHTYIKIIKKKTLHHTHPCFFCFLDYSLSATFANTFLAIEIFTSLEFPKAATKQTDCED